MHLLNNNHIIIDKKNINTSSKNNNETNKLFESEYLKNNYSSSFIHNTTKINKSAVNFNNTRNCSYSYDNYKNTLYEKTQMTSKIMHDQFLENYINSFKNIYSNYTILYIIIFFIIDYFLLKLIFSIFSLKYFKKYTAIELFKIICIKLIILYTYLSSKCNNKLIKYHNGKNMLYKYLFGTKHKLFNVILPLLLFYLLTNLFLKKIISLDVQNESHYFNVMIFFLYVNHLFCNIINYDIRKILLFEDNLKKNIKNNLIMNIKSFLLIMFINIFALLFINSIFGNNIETFNIPFSKKVSFIIINYKYLIKGFILYFYLEYSIQLYFIFINYTFDNYLIKNVLNSVEYRLDKYDSRINLLLLISAKTLKEKSQIELLIENSIIKKILTIDNPIADVSLFNGGIEIYKLKNNNLISYITKIDEHYYNNTTIDNYNFKVILENNITDNQIELIYKETYLELNYIKNYINYLELIINCTKYIEQKENNILNSINTLSSDLKLTITSLNELIKKIDMLNNHLRSDVSDFEFEINIIIQKLINLTAVLNY